MCTDPGCVSYCPTRITANGNDCDGSQKKSLSAPPRNFVQVLTCFEQTKGINAPGIPARFLIPLRHRLFSAFSMSSRAPSILPQLSADTPITQRDRFPPIFRNLPEFSPRDPFGLLPIRRRVQVTKSCVLEWCPIEKCLKPWFW
jgi:hypothetical protein